MRRLPPTAVAVLLAAASAGHVAYPVFLGVAGWRRRPEGPRPPTSGPAPRAPGVPAGPGDPADSWPAVSVVVPAFREAGVIRAKVADVLANGYPGPIEVLVVADGDPDTAALAQAAGARVLCPPERLGKSQALNAGLEAATAPVVVLSDANNRLAPGAIAALVRHFDDPTVGAVTGEKVETDGGGEGLYWRFESWLKTREWRLGTTIGLVGELAAVRASAWRPIPEDIATDDLWTALDVSGRGHRIAYEPAAVAIDPPVGSLRHQWERRTRSVSGALHVFARRRRQLGPSGGLVAVEIWGHRLVRYTVSPLAHVALLAIAARRARSSRLSRLFLLVHLVAALALARRASAPTGPGAEEGAVGSAEAASGPVAAVAAALSQGLFLQGVALGGMWRYLRGDRRTKWPRIERGAGPGDA